ncbi:phage terminase large subunit [Rufibacter soli]
MVTLKKVYAPLFNGDTRFFIVTGGRGSGKSFGVGSFLTLLTFEEGQKVLFTRYTLTSAKTSIIPEFNDKIDRFKAGDKFEITNDEVVNKTTNSSIIFKGIKTSSGVQTAALKSIQGVTAWVNDESEEIPDEETFDKINLSIRQKGVHNRVILLLNPAKKHHWIYKRFFEPNKIPDGFNGVVDGVTYIHTSYKDNIENLDQSFLEEVEKLRLTNLKKYNHVVLGHWADDDEENALWKFALIERNRVHSLPPLKRIVVAVDPAVTANKDSDETGIIVAGIDFEGIAYVLEDVSGKYSPNVMAGMAIQAYRAHQADRIVAEVNNGGDMVETILRNADRTISYKSVHASRGKVTRAEPVVALYEQGKVKHYKSLAKLELQMTTWAAKEGEKSPDRVDALVWALTDLMLTTKQEHFSI